MEKVSLLDTAGKVCTSWYVVYLPGENPWWWNTFLHPRFQHVQLWKSVEYGPESSDRFWILIDPGLEFASADVHFHHEPPWTWDPSMTVQRVQVIRPRHKVRQWMFFGMITCVEMAKVCMGINSWWVHTPRQLHRYIAKRNGILTSG